MINRVLTIKNLYRLVEIDVHIPKDELDRLESSENVEIEDIFLMDIDCENVQVEAECFSRTLDICLKNLFLYMKQICYDADGNLL